MVYLVLIILGACFGSFVNAYVWRSFDPSKKGKYKKVSVWHGRSMCPNCHHTLNWQDLIPVFSWAALKGRCRYCSKPISAQYPIVELLTSLLFVFSYIYWPYSFNREGIVLFISWLVISVLFMALIIIDLRWRILPNKIVTPLILIALLQVILRLIFFNAGFSLVLTSFWGVLFSAGIFYGIFLVSSGRWIGGGDVKLAIALGILLGGPLEAILMIFLASLIGCVVSFALIGAKRMQRNSMIPFGPLLIVATIICYLFGVHIIHWYKNFVL
jgi:prepilin signal peptidase PulO-like enzyme (type II secretory pathway)